MSTTNLTPEQQAELNKLLETQKPQEIEVKLDTGQVYKGKNEAEVIEQLKRAQENASKAIQQKSAELEEAKRLLQSVPAPKPSQEDSSKFDAVQYYNLFQTDPIAALDYVFEARFGVKPQDFQNRFQEIESETVSNRQLREVFTFKAKHPEFEDNQQYADLVMQRMAEMGYDPDKEFIRERDFEAAYWSLRAEGKINPNPVGAPNSVNTPPPTLPHSGVSNVEPGIDERMDKMNMKDLEAFMRQAGALK